MVSLMLDSDQPTVLLEPRFAGMRIASYADLATPELISAGGRRLVWFDRGYGDPHNVATIADIEPQLLSVADGAAKVKQWIEEKRPFPTAYHDRVQWQAVNEALAGEPYHHMVATLDGTLVPGGLYMAVVQFADAARLGFHADMSIVWDEGWNPLPAGPSDAERAALRQLGTTVAQGAAQLLAEIRMI